MESVETLFQQLYASVEIFYWGNLECTIHGLFVVFK